MADYKGKSHIITLSSTAKLKTELALPLLLTHF